MPNIKWLPSRSVNRREEHEQFYNRIWPKDDPFWDHNQPGNLWNCKCDWQQTDEPPTDNNPTSRIQHKGLDGNPAKTGHIFSDEASYIRTAPREAKTYAIHTERKIFRSTHESDSDIIKTSIGDILIDNITYIEVSKGAKTNESYFYKLQIAEHFSDFANKLVLIDGNEPIDLSHNNHNNIFYRRKAQFIHMKVYVLESSGFTFRIKIGEFKNGSLNLYAITEP